VFADVLSVFADAESGQHWGTLADRLAAQIPERWEGVTSDALSAQLRGLGIPSVPVKVARVPGRGCRRADLEHAMGQR
jgi:S-DNA-T family DNA segregation ATPase FtsK/SpoIIIE